MESLTKQVKELNHSLTGGKSNRWQERKDRHAARRKEREGARPERHYDSKRPYRNPNYWVCECEDDYIHGYAAEKFCGKCGLKRDEGEAALVCEVAKWDLPPNPDAPAWRGSR